MILREDDVVRWGRRIGEYVTPPVFIGLRGELGAGKSVLARAIARGAGVEGSLPSPTFNLLFRYPARGESRLVHLDLYRLRDPEELWEIGWEELGAGSDIVLVEWPERAGPHLPESRWEITLASPEPGSNLRVVKADRIGNPPQIPGFPVTVERRT